MKRLLVILLGRIYESAKLPDKVERLIGMNCFDAAMLTALRHRDLTYCEGFAKVRGGKWIYHGWLTDGKHAFDVTWYAKDSSGNIKHIPAKHVKYIGIPMDTTATAKFMTKTGYQGVLANWWRAPVLAIKTIAYGIKNS